jgi:hypothetical protein
MPSLPISGLICAQFTILAGNGTNTTEPYLKFIQADNTPWLITFTVPLKTITDNTNLPPDVKQKLANWDRNSPYSSLLWILAMRQQTHRGQKLVAYSRNPRL